MNEADSSLISGLIMGLIGPLSLDVLCVSFVLTLEMYDVFSALNAFSYLNHRDMSM